MYEEYLNKVYKIAEVKYDIEKDIIDSYLNEVKQCYKQNYTPRRTVEVIACHLFN